MRYTRENADYVTYLHSLSDMLAYVSEMQSQGIQVTHYGKVPTRKQLERTKRDISSM